MFKPVSSKVDFDAMEKGVLSFWQENDTFKKSLAQTEGGEQFVFFDGPPFATGLPHYGHLLAGTIKDIIPRYRTSSTSSAARWSCATSPNGAPP